MLFPIYVNTQNAVNKLTFDQRKGSFCFLVFNVLKFFQSAVDYPFTATLQELPSNRTLPLTLI